MNEIIVQTSFGSGDTLVTVPFYSDFSFPLFLVRSLTRNKIGNKGATAIGEALMVNCSITEIK